MQEGITCNSAAQSKRGSVVNTVVERLNCLFAGIVSNATDAHNHEDAGMSRSDYEVKLKVLTLLVQLKTFHSSKNSECSLWLAEDCF